MSKPEFLGLLNHQMFHFSPRSGWFVPVDLSLSLVRVKFSLFFPRMINCELEFNHQSFATNTLPCKSNKFLSLPPVFAASPNNIVLSKPVVVLLQILDVF